MKKLKFSIFMAVIVLMMACAKHTFQAPTPMPPTSFTEEYVPLSAMSVDELVEISKFAVDGYDSAIGEVYYALNEDDVLAVYHKEGTLVRWDVGDGDGVISYTLGITSAKALQFSRSGTILMGATESKQLGDEANQVTEVVRGIALWDTMTGEFIDCLDHPCYGDIELAPLGLGGVLNAVIDPSGRWVFRVRDLVYGVSDLTGQTPGLTAGINDLDAAYQWSLGGLAYDSINARTALIFQEGRVDLLTNFTARTRQRTVVDGEKNNLQNIISAEFDPVGQFLAFIRGETLSIWQLSDGTRLYLESNITDPVTLHFDQTGNLLFIGTSEKIIVWDIENKQIAQEYDAPGLSALAISEDNRMVIWGDNVGVVHLWGVANR